MNAAPGIVAITAVRDVTDRTRAMEALSDKRSHGEQVVLVLVIFAVIIFAPLGLAVLEPGPYASAAFTSALLFATLRSVGRRCLLR